MWVDKKKYCYFCDNSTKWITHENVMQYMLIFLLIDVKLHKNSKLRSFCNFFWWREGFEWVSSRTEKFLVIFQLFMPNAKESKKYTTCFQYTQNHNSATSKGNLSYFFFPSLLYGEASSKYLRSRHNFGFFTVYNK